MHSGLEHRRQLGRAAEQVFALVQVERGHGSGGGQRMAGVGVAMQQLDRARRGRIDHGVVHFAAHRHGAHRHRRVVDRLGHGDQVRRHVEALGRGGRAETAEGGDHFIEDQQDAVPAGDLAQFFQVAGRRHQHAGGAGQRLDDHGGDVGRVMQREDALQLVGEVRAPLRLALGEGGLGDVERGRQVVRARHQVGRVGLAVRADAAHRHAAEAHAVVAALTADKAGALAFAARAVVRQRDLQCGVDRLRTRVGEEDAVQALRHDRSHLGGSLER
ncbi:hypothetical protein D9M69_412270 [compost metagenome]